MLSPVCIELLFSLHPAALHEFPNDIFTNEDRRQGAVVLHVLCVSTLLMAPPQGPREGLEVGGWGVREQKGFPSCSHTCCGVCEPQTGDQQTCFLKGVFYGSIVDVQCFGWTEK